MKIKMKMKMKKISTLKEMDNELQKLDFNCLMRFGVDFLKQRFFK